MPSRALRHVRAFARGALRELPIETAAVVAAAVSLITAVHRDDVSPWTARVLFAAPIACALAFALTLAARAGRIGRRAQVGGGGGLAVLVLAAVWATMPGAAGDEAFAWSYAAALFAAILIPFPVAALVAPGGSEGRALAFSSFLRGFLEQTQTSIALGGAAFAAIAVVFAALHGLFDLSVERLGVEVGVGAGALVTLGWLYGLLPAPGHAAVPAIWRRLVTAVGAPFVAVMLVILSAYEVWALVRGELPRNMLSPMVIAAGAVGSLCALVIVAIVRTGASEGGLGPADPHPWMRSWPVRIARAFPLAILALAPMACWALAVRIDELGLTPNRVARLYALVALVVVGGAGSLRYLRRRPPLGWQVPAVAAVLAVLAAAGPLGVVPWSLRSQAARLDDRLTASGVANRTVGAAVPSVVVADEIFDAMASSLDVLDDLGGEAGLRRVLTGDVASCRFDSTGCLERLGVRRAEPPAAEARWRSASTSEPFAVDGRVVVTVRLSPGQPVHAGDLMLVLEGARVEARERGQAIAAAHLDAAATAAVASGALAAEPLPFTGAGADRLGHLLITDVSVTRGDPVVVDHVAAIWIRPAR
jgi:hypothetical protein